MAQTATSLADVLYERWTDTELQVQFEKNAGPLKRIEQIKATMVGKQAQVPIWKTLAGGFTSVGAGGGDLNTAGQLGVDQALYTLVTHGQPIELDISALNQASGSGLQAVIGSKNMEIAGGVDVLRKQMVRALVTNGDSIVAQCDAGGPSTTVELLASPSGTSYGYDAIARGWLQVGTQVDIGTTGDTDVLTPGGTTVTAINNSATDPKITIGVSITTVAGTHFVYLSNPNSATAANPEMNGLRNMVNTTGAVGGLNPANAGEEWWAAAQRDTATTVFSLDLALNLQQGVLQNSDELFTDVWTGFKQQRNFYALLQNQVRFQGETKMGAGDVGGVTWNNMKVDAFPDVLDSDWWCLTLKDFVRVHGEITKPTWATQIEGDSGGGQLRWAQGSTRFKDACFYPMQVGLRRRNTHSGATGLTA